MRIPSGRHLTAGDRDCFEGAGAIWRHQFQDRRNHLSNLPGFFPHWTLWTHLDLFWTNLSGLTGLTGLSGLNLDFTLDLPSGLFLWTLQTGPPLL
jgi:hypothetical protein